MGRGPAEQRKRGGCAAQPRFAAKGGKQEDPAASYLSTAWAALLRKAHAEPSAQQLL